MTPNLITALIVQLLIILVCHKSTQDELYLLVLVPFPSEDYHRTFTKGHSIVPAVELAVEQINNSTKLLQNHTLGIIEGDTGCNLYTETTISFTKYVLLGDKPVLGIVGPACTEASVHLAEITQQNRFGIVQAMMANFDSLEDHQRYRHTFGMISSFNILVDTLYDIAMENSWKNIGVLYDASREFFQAILHSFVDRSTRIPDLRYDSWPVFLEPDFLLPLDEVIDNNSTRVIFAIMSARVARHVACLAGIKGMVYPVYQFIYADRYIDDFINENSDFSFGSNPVYYCNKSIIEKGINRAILLRYELNSTDSEMFLNETAQLTVGEVKNQYRDKLQEKRNVLGQNLSESVYAYPYYDATWAFAMSIDQAIKERGSFSRNNDRFLNNSPEAEIIRAKFAALNFQGISTRIQFDNKTGHVTNDVSIFQVQEREVTRDNITYIKDEFKVRNIFLHPALIVFGLLFTTLALALNTLFHVVNIYYREISIIKASSPRLNHFIFIACYLMVFLVYIQTIHYGFIGQFNHEMAKKVLCNISEFLYPICLMLIIGTVTVKLGRLYSIFNRAFKKQYFLQDKYLALIVLLLVLVVVLLNIPFLVVAPFEEREIVYFTKGTETVRHIEAVCLPSVGSTFLPVLPFLFDLLLAAFMFLLALFNRKIKLREYRSKESIIFTYLLTLSLGIMGTILAVIYILGLGVDVVYSAVVVVLLTIVFLCNFTLFVPTFYPIIEGKLPKCCRILTLTRTMSANKMLSDKVP